MDFTVIFQYISLLLIPVATAFYMTSEDKFSNFYWLLTIFVNILNMGLVIRGVC